MNKSIFQLEIITVETELFSDKASRLFVTGTEGDLEILAHHAPLLTQLASERPIRIIMPSGHEKVFAIFEGILEVQPKQTTILAYVALRAKDLDGQSKKL